MVSWNFPFLTWMMPLGLAPMALNTTSSISLREGGAPVALPSRTNRRISLARLHPGRRVQMPSGDHTSILEMLSVLVAPGFGELCRRHYGGIHIGFGNLLAQHYLRHSLPFSYCLSFCPRSFLRPGPLTHSTQSYSLSIRRHCGGCARSCGPTHLNRCFGKLSPWSCVRHFCPCAAFILLSSFPLWFYSASLPLLCSVTLHH